MMREWAFSRFFLENLFSYYHSQKNLLDEKLFYTIALLQFDIELIIDSFSSEAGVESRL
jgi:hypothetical protein